MTRLLPLLLLVGCVPDLVFCELGGREDIIRNLGQCPEACYEDNDGDRFGDALVDLDEGEVCVGEGLAPQGGDCDDEDDNNFPGNPEVCDGRDNDCARGADFDVENEEEEVDGSLIFSCTPADTVRIFRRGGGHLGGQPVDGRRTSIRVHPGDVVTGEVRVRVLASADLVGRVAGGLSLSWEPNPQLGFLPQFDPVDDALGQPDVGYTDFDFEVLGIPVPESAQGDQQLYVNFAASVDTRAPYVGSLTNPTYCCEDCDELEPSCMPVWNGGGVWGHDLDLADLDDLDMAGCLSFGAARFFALAFAEDDAGERCTIGLDDPCYPVHLEEPAGCTYVKLFLEEG